MMTNSKFLCIGLLMGATMLMPVSRAWAEGEAWMKGGQQTNNVSKTAQTVTETARYGMMAYQGVQAMRQIVRMWKAFAAMTESVGGATPYLALLNFDIPGLAVDVIAYMNAKNKNAKLNEDIPELTAAVRQIGDPEELEEGAEEMFNPQDVEIATLKNVGLEALKDLSGGKVYTTPEEIMGAASIIEQGFGTMNLSAMVSNVDMCASVPESYRAICEEQKLNAASKVDDSQREAYTTRRLAHLQYTGTAGVARADLGVTVAASERAENGTLYSYVGSGGTLSGNAKVLVGLDLILTQRLNLVNMVYGQQTANEAALALQYITD